MSARRPSRANRLAEALAGLEPVQTAIEELRDEVQEHLDNLPDSFRDGAPGERLSEAVDALDELLSTLEEAAATEVEF